MAFSFIGRGNLDYKSSLTWLIRYINYWILQFLTYVSFPKAKVLLPQAQVTIADFGYPVYTFWFYCSQHSYAINAYHHWWCEFESRSTLSDKVCQWLATVRWFSPGTQVSSTNNIDPPWYNEILLKVALSNIKQTSNYLSYQSFAFERTRWRLFQKHVVHIKFDIYVFIKHDINMENGLDIIFVDLPFLCNI